ncbi:hypothetical protein [Arthrobacter sp. B2a2-09]|uniref:hypothetical protein n=1 Tax=Arthrobacter sp. B2a2-09 TaxID=2952822 RepID=UPI0022CD3855|nr:hypothetical protein [Arthrobacter sp. B2a2-09]MCZ9880469.1 hypothetical protein [Arthrobacter sp. B2a2-09]
MRKDSHVVPFDLDGGWPMALSGQSVIACEAGITLGSVDLCDETWQVLQGRGLVSLRVDEHPESYAWTVTHPDGRSETRNFVIPTTPVEIPDTALQDQRSLTEWVMDRHGDLGRLLIWDHVADWWIVNEPDLELTLICSKRSQFQGEFDQWATRPFAWVNDAFWTNEGIRTAVVLSRKYSLGWKR